MSKNQRADLKMDIPRYLFPENESKEFIRLRWVVIAVISMLICLDKWSLFYRLKPLSILALFLISNLFLTLSPKKIFNIHYFIDAIFIIDTLFVTLLLYFVGKADSDFYLIFYFLIILLVSLNQDVRSIVVMGAVISLIYGWLLFSLGILKTENSAHLFLRVLLIFLITLFYSYILNRANTTRQTIQKYRQLAMHDELTRLPNRRYLSEYLNFELKRALRYKRPISFIMIDIDDFKAVNDKYGHDAGDIILKEVAALLDKNKRENDLVARYGGEEFLWVAPETDMKDANSITNRMLDKIRGNVFRVDSNYLKITISIGASTFQPKKHTIEIVPEVVNKADEALYQAKYNGKNTCIYLEC